MAPLLERGREALRLRIAAMPARDRPLGAARIDVVTHEDFVTNAELCLRHVLRNGSRAHILSESGALCALLEKRIFHW